jgi:hypothetical protein
MADLPLTELIESAILKNSLVQRRFDLFSFEGNFTLFYADGGPCGPHSQRVL